LVECQSTNNMSAGSVVSFGSHGSPVGSNLSVGSSTGSSGKSRPSRYRTVNSMSSVDELLFAKPNPTSSPEVQTKAEPVSTKCKPSDGSKKSKEQEVIQVITKDMIRKLRVPRDDPSGQSLIMSSDHFSRIRNASRVLTRPKKRAWKAR